MRSLWQDVMPLFVFAAMATFSGCSASVPLRAPAATATATTSDTTGDCAQGFVEVAPDGVRCSFALTAAGGLLHEGRTVADPLVVSYRQDAGARTPIAAGKIVLFPASPSGRFRFVQACESAGADGLCWKVFVFDRDVGRLSEAVAGKYGPDRWLSWSPDEQHVALVSRSEGASWIHVVEAMSGRSLAFPGHASNENWLVQPATLAWTGPRSFAVTVARCVGCPTARVEIRFSM